MERKEEVKQHGLPIEAFEEYTDSVIVLNNELRSKLSTIMDVNEDLFVSMKSNLMKSVDRKKIQYLKESTREKSSLRTEITNLTSQVKDLQSTVAKKEELIESFRNSENERKSLENSIRKYENTISQYKQD